MYFPKNILPVSINGQSILQSPTLPSDQRVNALPIKKPIKLEHIHTPITLHVITLRQILQYTVHRRVELLQPPFNLVFLNNEPFLLLNIVATQLNMQGITKQSRQPRNLLRQPFTLLHPPLNLLPLHHLHHVPREQLSKATIQIAGHRNVGVQRRRVVVLLLQQRLPEPCSRVARLLPVWVTERGGDVVDGVESERLRLVLAFFDQSLHVVAAGRAEAEAELHLEIRLRRTVEAGGMWV